MYIFLYIWSKCWQRGLVFKIVIKIVYVIYTSIRLTWSCCGLE